MRRYGIRSRRVKASVVAMGRIIDLFGHSEADARFFAGMAILEARVGNQRLYMELHAPALPPPVWMKGLIVVVGDPLTGAATHARIDLIFAQKGTHFGVRTTSISEALVTLSPATTIHVMSSGGRQLGGCVRGLLS